MRYFKFRYNMKSPHYWKKECAGAAVVEVYTLSDIADLMKMTGHDVHGLFIYHVSRHVDVDDWRTGITYTVHKERDFVFGYSRDEKKLLLGECNFYEGDGKGDS